jgi:hypothetical protein
MQSPDPNGWDGLHSTFSASGLNFFNNLNLFQNHVPVQVRNLFDTRR